MERLSSEEDLQSFLQPPNRWPNYEGYEPLNQENREIRLLHVEFKPKSREICARLEHVSLHDTPSFYALSYYWGSPDRQRSIKLGGQDVLVRATLYTFLTILCHEGQQTPLWLDALCINQRDNAERSQQVAMMSDIYQSALGVKAWIGYGDSDSEYALGFLQHRDDPKLAGSANISEVRVRAQQALLSVGHRPYWHRLWVIQELALARTVIVYCGLRSVAWTVLVDAVNESLHSALHSHRTGIQGDAESLETSDARGFDLFLHSRSNALYITHEQIWEPLITLNTLRNTLRETSPSHFNLFEQVFAFHQYGCVEKRDKVFGLLSLASPESCPTVDYTASFVDVLSDMLSQAFNQKARRYVESKREATTAVTAVNPKKDNVVTPLHESFHSENQSLLPGFQNRLLLKLLRLLQVFQVDQDSLERSLQLKFHDRDHIFSCKSIGTIGTTTTTIRRATRSPYWNPRAWLFIPYGNGIGADDKIAAGDEVVSILCHGLELRIPYLIFRQVKQPHESGPRSDLHRSRSGSVIVGAVWRFNSLSTDQHFPLIVQGIARGHVEIVSETDATSTPTPPSETLRLRCSRAFALAIFMTPMMDMYLGQPYKNILLSALQRREERQGSFGDNDNENEMAYRWSLPKDDNAAGITATDGEKPFQLLDLDGRLQLHLVMQNYEDERVDWIGLSTCLEREHKLLRSGTRSYVLYSDEEKKDWGGSS